MGFLSIIRIFGQNWLSILLNCENVFPNSKAMFYYKSSIFTKSEIKTASVGFPLWLFVGYSYLSSYFIMCIFLPSLQSLFSQMCETSSSEEDDSITYKTSVRWARISSCRGGFLKIYSEKKTQLSLQMQFSIPLTNKTPFSFRFYSSRESIR